MYTDHAEEVGPESARLAAIVGENVRELRALYGIRQEDLAHWATDYGLKWNLSRISELEKGKIGLSVSAFVLLALCLSRATGANITLASLLNTTKGIELSDHVTVEAEDLRAVFGDAPVTFEREWGDAVKSPTDSLNSLRELTSAIDAASKDLARHYGSSMSDDLSTQRAAKKLGSTTDEITETSIKLFGKPLPFARDDEAGANATAQRRGIVTRRLVDQIGHELWSAKNG